MLTEETVVRKIVENAMNRYAVEHEGKKGIARMDVIEQVLSYDGDMDDFRAVMIEGLKRINSHHHIYMS